jgi:phage terminase large subunit-like protein
VLSAAPPRIATWPKARSSAGAEAVELAASAGLILDDWQALVLDRALAERKDGKWASFEVGLIVPRQNGKGSILEARELAGLFLFGESLILHSAHEFKTAAEAFRRVLTLVESSDDLRKRVSKVRTSHGEEGIELTTGQRLRFVARSTGSGRGFSGDCVILDEAYRLPQEALGALMPTLSARPNPQLWYASSAGHVDSDVLRALRDRGSAAEEHLCYLEWSADPGSQPDDPEAWRQANPALGIRISEEHVAREQAAMPAAEFARERLGIWSDPGLADTAIASSEWAKCVDQSSTVLDPVALGVDVSPDGATSIAIAGARSDGLLHVEVIDHKPGTAWAVERIQALVRRWSPSAVVLDAGAPAGALLPDLERVGVQVRKVAGREMAQAAVALAAHIDQQTVRHLQQPDLDTAVAAARRRMVGDLWAFGRRGSFADISPLCAAALAAWGHAQTAGREPQILDIWSLDDQDE